MERITSVQYVPLTPSKMDLEDQRRRNLYTILHGYDGHNPGIELWHADGLAVTYDPDPPVPEWASSRGDNRRDNLLDGIYNVFPPYILRRLRWGFG